MWNETLARSTRRRMPCSWNNERLHFPGNSCDSMRSRKPTKDCKQTTAHWLPWQPTTWHPSHCHRLPWGLFGFFVDFFLLLAMVMWCGGLKSGAVSTVGFGRGTLGAGIKESLGTYIVTGVDYYCFFFFLQALQIPDDPSSGAELYWSASEGKWLKEGGLYGWMKSLMR